MGLSERTTGLPFVLARRAHKIDRDVLSKRAVLGGRAQ